MTTICVCRILCSRARGRSPTLTCTQTTRGFVNYTTDEILLKTASPGQILALARRARGGPGGNVLKYAKLSEKAFPPSKGSDYAAGYDLRSAYKYIISAHGKELVKTDLQIEVPFGTYGRIAPRSGLAWKNHIDVGAGVIDADYRGNVGVVLFNHSNEDFEVAPGDRIAQLICEKITYPKIEEVDTLTDTSRGADGFGSTGMK